MENTDFKQFYQSELKPFLKTLDRRRYKLMVVDAIMVAIILVGIVYLSDTNHLRARIFQNGDVNKTLFDTVAYGMGVLMAILVLWIYIRKQKWVKGFRQDYKLEVVAKIVAHVGGSLQYDPDKKIPTEEFIKSKMFSSKIDRAYGEDCFTGKVGETEFVFSELDMERKNSGGSSGSTSTMDKDTWSTIFKGLFFMADFNKTLKTETIVLPDNWEDLLGNVARKLQRATATYGELIQLENPEFEKYFRTYSKDQIEARYALSPALMERIVAFRKKTGAAFSLSFAGSKIYIALPLKTDLFEPRVWKSNDNYEYVSSNLGFILLFVSIVEELNLNTRIWGA